MWIAKSVKKRLRPKLLAVALVFGSSTALADQADYGGYYLIVGPSVASGDPVGRGIFAGLAAMPYGEVGFWHGIFAGGLLKKHSVLHSDFLFGLNYMNGGIFFVGPGLRSTESKRPVAQFTYGIAIGPTTMAMRRYRGAQGLVTEGVITLNVPILKM